LQPTRRGAKKTARKNYYARRKKKSHSYLERCGKKGRKKKCPYAWFGKRGKKKKGVSQ